MSYRDDVLLLHCGVSLYWPRCREKWYDKEMKARAKKMLDTDNEIDVTWYIEKVKETLDNKRHDQASISELYLLTMGHTVR